MRQKHRQLIITFSTTTQALRVEKFCQENGICGRMIPVPGEIKGRMRTGMENRTTGTGAYCRQTATGRDGVGDNDSNGVILK